MEYKDRNARSMLAKLHIIKTASEQEPDGEKEADRAAQIQLDLELAQERLQMRRALVARLVDEYNSTPTLFPAKALRSALVERDLTEEECERLHIILSKIAQRHDNSA